MRFVPLGVGDAFTALHYSTCVAVEAEAPLLAAVVALARVGVRRVLRERDVIVRVDEAGGDRAVGAGDHRLATHRAVAAASARLRMEEVGAGVHSVRPTARTAATARGIDRGFVARFAAPGATPATPWA